MSGTDVNTQIYVCISLSYVPTKVWEFSLGLGDFPYLSPFSLVLTK